MLEGIQPVLESAHVFLPELNPTLSYLSFAREQVATFLAPGGSALGGNGIGGYRSSRFAEHYLPQSAIIDSRSLERRATRPFWERANSYVAPNAWERSIGLGAIEAFDCGPGGRRGAEPERLGRHLGAALLRGAAAALPGPALPAAAPRAGAGRGGPGGSRRKLARPGPRASSATPPHQLGVQLDVGGAVGAHLHEARSAHGGLELGRRRRPGGARAPRARASAAMSTPCGVAMWRS